MKIYHLVIGSWVVGISICYWGEVTDFMLPTTMGVFIIIVAFILTGAYIVDNWDKLK